MTHVVVLVADTFREPRSVPGFVPDRTMPFLSGMSARGQVYRQFLASSSWTIPSHVSLLTGREPWSVVYAGEAGLTIPLGPSLADVWRTKTGEDSPVWSANGLIGPLFRTIPGYGPYNRGSLNLWAAGRCSRFLAPIRGPVMAANGIRPPDALVDAALGQGGSAPGSSSRAIAYGALGAGFYACTRALFSGRGLVGGVARHLKARDGRSPLHALVNLMETHEPYALAREAGPAGLPPWLHLPINSLSSFQSDLAGVPSAPALMRSAYLRNLGQLDDRLRDLFRAFERADLFHDALVLLVSDHGQSLGEAGVFGHGNSLHDEVVKVPCVAWRFRDGKAQGPTKETSGPFDHRHLHQALRAFMEGGGASDLSPLLEDALRARPTAASFQEGSPSLALRRSQRRGEVPIVRALRLSDGHQEATLELEQVDGVLRPTSAAEERAPPPLREEAHRALRVGREKGVGSVPGPGGDVDRRLSAWGYV